MPIKMSFDLILLKESPFPFWSGLEVAMQTRITGAESNMCLSYSSYCLRFRAHGAITLECSYPGRSVWSRSYRYLS